MRQRHVTHAEPVVVAQRAKRILDGVTTLDTEQRCDAAGCVGTLDVVRAQCELEIGRIALDHTQRNVDLLELDTRETTLAGFRQTGYPYGPELSADAPLAQPGNIGVAGRAHT